MRELIYTVANAETKSYAMAQEISKLKNAPIKSKVVDSKEDNPRAGKYAGLTPLMKYSPAYKK